MLNTDTIRITPELLALIAEIDEFKGAWRALGALEPERLRDEHRRRKAAVDTVLAQDRIACTSPWPVSDRRPSARGRRRWRRGRCRG